MADRRDYPKVVLVLGGGGARGFAHIGVLQVLREEGFQISGIVGTSMGALIGSLFAAGTDLYYLGRLVEYMKWEELIDWRITGLGLINGVKVQTLIDLLTKGKRFEDLSLPFWAVATDLFSGEAITFKSGPLAPAIRASVSIPGVFSPVEVNGKILVDGGVAAGVPVLIAQEMNPDLTIAVNVGFDHTQHQVNTLFDVLSKVVDIMGNRLDEMQLGAADLIIAPQLGTIGTMSFQMANQCIEAGRNATAMVIPQLEALIRRRTTENRKQKA